MRAHIKPLEGKYYGTKIEVEVDDGKMLNYGIISIWFYGSKPSARQLAVYDISEADRGSERWTDLFCDNHIETALTYRVAEAIVAALAGIKDSDDD